MIGNGNFGGGLGSGPPGDRGIDQGRVGNFSGGFGQSSATGDARGLGYNDGTNAYGDAQRGSVNYGGWASSPMSRATSLGQAQAIQSQMRSGLTPASGYTAAPARQSLPAAVPALPAAVPAVVAPPVSLTPAVTTPTVPSTPPSVPIGPSGMPSLDALAAQITGQSLASIQGNTAPVAAAPSMAMSSASPASRSPAGYAAAARAVGARASTPSMGMTAGGISGGAANAGSLGGFGNAANVGISSNVAGKSDVGVPSLNAAFGAATERANSLARALNVSRTRDTSPGVSAYGAASRSVADLTGFTGNSVLGQSRSNVIGGFQDPSTNAVGFSAAPGLSSRIGAANSAINSSFGGQLIGGVMSGMQSMGLPAPVGLPGTQADIARSQFAAENPLSSRPVAEVTVTGDLAQRPAQEVSDATLEAARQVALEAREERARNASMQMAEEPMGLLAARNPTQQARANPYGETNRDTSPAVASYGNVDASISASGMTAPSGRESLASALANISARQQALANPYGETNRDTSPAVASYGNVNPAISPPGATSPSGRIGLADPLRDIAQARANQQRASQAQASTNAIRSGLLDIERAQQQRRAQQQASTAEIGGLLSQMEPQVEPAAIPNAQPMPNAPPTVNIDPEFSRVQRAIDAFREFQRQAGIGGAATDINGLPSTDPAANAAQEAVDEAKATESAGQKEGTEPDFSINTDLAGTFRDRGTIESVQGIVFHHTAGRGSPKDVAAGMGRKSVQFIIDRNGQIHQMTKKPNSRGAHTSDSINNKRWAGPRINSGTSIGVEIIARNDADVTPAQAESAARLAAWASQQPWAKDDFVVVGHGQYQGDQGAVEARLAGRWTGKQMRPADEGKKALDAYNRLSDKEKEALSDALLAGEIGGDIDPDDMETLWNGALTDAEAEEALQASLAEQQGYSQTDEGKWTDGAKSFDSPIEAVKSLPLMDQLRAYVMFMRGSVPPPAGRADSDRGGGDIYIPPQTNGRRSRNSGGSRAPTPPAPTYPGTPDWWQNWRRNYGQYGLLGPRPVATII